MTSALALLLLLVLIGLGLDIALGVGLVAVALLMFSLETPAVVIGQVAFSSLDSYVLIAIPFFVLAGNLATRGNIAELIFHALGAVLRCVRGGMAISLMVAATAFAAMNGSSVACTVALGPSAMQILPREGYPKRFTAGMVAVAGTLGLMIPPSLSFIVIGSMMELPILDLFIAGILPGFMEAVLLMIAVAFMSWRNGYGIKTDRPDWRTFRRKGTQALPGVLLPVSIIVAIYFGIMTPTEISAFAVAYAALLAFVIYRTISLSEGFHIARESLLQTVLVFMIIMSGSLLAFLLVRLGITQDIVAILNSFDVGPIGFLIIANLLLLALGTVFEGASMVVLTAPILFPVATSMGIDPIHFAVIFTACVEIATLTPPIGMNVFVMARVSGLSVTTVGRAIGPFYLVRFFSLMLINAFPWLSLALLNR